MSKLWNIAIVGATGLVGNQIIECLEERDFPVASLRLLAVGKKDGDALELKGNPVLVEPLTPDAFAGIDIAFFTSGRECSLEFCPAATEAGAVCIDISSAWRMDPKVPLVVPEVNPEAIAGYKKKGIIANPNCTTIQMVVALKAIEKLSHIKRVHIATYQSASGAGASAMAELIEQTKQVANNEPPVIRPSSLVSSVIIFILRIAK